MTPEDRAGKIDRKTSAIPMSPDTRFALRELIAAEIRQAENEAAAGMQVTMKEIADRWVVDAYKKAATVVRSFDTCVCHGSPIECNLALAAYAILDLEEKS